MRGNRVRTSMRRGHKVVKAISKEEVFVPITHKSKAGIEYTHYNRKNV